MKSIGGNVTAVLQIKGESTKNNIGERIHDWVDIKTLKGFLDFSSGQNGLSGYNAKIQDTTHVFLCDYEPLTIAQDIVTSENARLMIGSTVYQILLIDDPMGLHQHLEFYLQYVGGGLGV